MKIDPVANSPGRPASPLSPAGRRIMWLVLAPFIIVAIFSMLLLSLSLLHIARPYSISNNAMSPAIAKGDQFYSNEISYRMGSPHRGDVVCFWSAGITRLEERNHGVDTTYVKRIVGLPGETISLQGGQLWVNGHAAPELADIHYEPAPGGTLFTGDGDSFVVPAASYFVLGDNSPNSLDSRYWGCVPAANLRGRAMIRFWPLQRLGFIK